VRIEPEPKSYESTPTSRPLAPTQAGKCEKLGQSCYLVVHWLQIEQWTFQSRIQHPNCSATKMPQYFYYKPPAYIRTI